MPKARTLEGATSGNLCLTSSWPGQMRTVWGDHSRFFETYFKTYRGKYFTGDGCRRDEDGYYWITGRVDDVINVSGHRVGTRGGRKLARRRIRRSPKPRSSASRMTSRAGDLRLRHAERRRGRQRRSAQGTHPGSATRYRRPRRAGKDPLHACTSQNPLGQDHAPHPAQDRRRRDRRLRRHFHARRSDNRRRSSGRSAMKLVAAAILVALAAVPPRGPRSDARHARLLHSARPTPTTSSRSRFHGPHKLIVDSVGGRSKQGEFILIDRRAGGRETVRASATGACMPSGANHFTGSADRRSWSR